MKKTVPTSHFGRGSMTGMALAAVAFALLTSCDVIFKLLAAGGHPTYQILLINACFALIPILLWTAASGGLERLATVRLPQHVLRGATSVLATFAAIYAYSRLPLTDFYAIMFAGPLVVTALAAFWLGEKLEVQRWLAIMVGFLGILIVTNPLNSPLLNGHRMVMDAHQNAAMLGRFAAFISVFCYALSVIMIRRMRVVESNMSFAFYGYFSCVIITGFLCVVNGVPVFRGDDILHLALSGCSAGVSSICLMTAYHRTPVALVAPFQYTQIIWGAIAGFVIWQHVPSHHLMAGSAVVALSGLYVIHREIKGAHVAARAVRL